MRIEILPSTSVPFCRTGARAWSPPSSRPDAGGSPMPGIALMLERRQSGVRPAASARPAEQPFERPTAQVSPPEPREQHRSENEPGQQLERVVGAEAVFGADGRGD